MWNAIDLVMYKFKESYYKALTRITSDLAKISRLADDDGLKDIPLNSRDEETLLQVISQPWDDASLSYWTDYGIDLDILKSFDVYNVKYVYINKVLRYKATRYNPIFAYKAAETRAKVYRPFAMSRQAK